MAGMGTQYQTPRASQAQAQPNASYGANPAIMSRSPIDQIRQQYANAANPEAMGQRVMANRAQAQAPQLQTPAASEQAMNERIRQIQANANQLQPSDPGYVAPVQENRPGIVSRMGNAVYDYFTQ